MSQQKVLNFKNSNSGTADIIVTELALGFWDYVVEVLQFNWQAAKTIKDSDFVYRVEARSSNKKLAR